MEQIRENPYYQFFIGLPGYQDEEPFVPSLLVEFRKRLTDDILGDINEMIIAYNTSDDDPPAGYSGDNGDNLLNEARGNLESLIDDICFRFYYYKPRMYHQNARKDYLSLAKKIRKAIKKQLQYVNRDLGYIDLFLAQDDVYLNPKQAERLAVIREPAQQQQYMYDNKVHSVKDRIVSISQPYIRPIVRGKASSPVEFGAKLDMSIDEKGLARLEKLSFDAYNESDVLINAVERYRVRTGRHPERVLADQIYRTRKNRAYCKKNGIRMSGPALGRPRQMTPEEKKQSYSDNTDRIEVERGFSLAERCCGLGLLHTKLDITTRSSIALSIIAMNVSRLTGIILRCMELLIFSRCRWQKDLSENTMSELCFCIEF